MAAKDYIWYTDTVNEESGLRRRIMFLPSHTTTLAADPDELIATRPEWGDAPADGSLWRQLPEGCVEIETPGETGWERHPIGWTEAATSNVSVDFGMLRGIDGLSAAIATTATDTSLTLATGVSRTVRTMNVWWVIEERPGGGDDLDIWNLLFCGCQRPSPSTKGRIIPKVTRVETFPLMHIARVVMDALPMKDVCAAIRASGITVLSRRRAYDFVWRHASGHKMFWASGYSNASLGFVSLKLVIEAFWDTIAVVLNRMLRLDGGVDFSASNTGTPTETMTFSKQRYDGDTSKGAALLYEHLYIIGSITRDGDTDPVEGLLVEGADGEGRSWATARTPWEWWKAWCNGFLLKSTWATGWIGGKVRMGRPFHAWPHPDNTSMPVSLLDIDDPSYDEEEVTPTEQYERGYGMIATASARIKQTPTTGHDGEVNEREEKRYGAYAEGGVLVECVLDTHPERGDLSEVSFATAFGPDFSSGAKGLQQGEPEIFKLYYFDTPDFAAQSLPIRVHHDVVVNLGGDEEFGNYPFSIMLPVLTVSSTVDPTSIATFSKWLSEMSTNITLINRSGGMLRAIPDALLGWLADKQPVMYTLRLTYDGFSQAFGYEATLGDGAGPFTAELLADDDTIYTGDLFGRCYVTRIQPYAEYANGGPVHIVKMMGVRS